MAIAKRLTGTLAVGISLSRDLVLAHSSVSSYRSGAVWTSTLVLHLPLPFSITWESRCQADFLSFVEDQFLRVSAVAVGSYPLSTKRGIPPAGAVSPGVTVCSLASLPPSARTRRTRVACGPWEAISLTDVLPVVHKLFSGALSSVMSSCRTIARIPQGPGFRFLA